MKTRSPNKTTRFLAFVRDNHERQTDSQLIAFTSWIKPVIEKNLHAGLPQLVLYIQQHNPSEEIKKGFVKWCMIYQQDPSSMLTKNLKENPQGLLEFISAVFWSVPDEDNKG